MTRARKSDFIRAQRYRVHGLTVFSEFVLPAALGDSAAADKPDVYLRRGFVPQDLSNAVTRGPNWAVEGGRFLLCVPGVARFLMDDGASITMEAEAGEADALVFLMGPAFAVLLYQRGHMVLHASAVCIGGNAVLFCGPSGAGKSTLAAALSLENHAHVVDDVCCITFDAKGKPFVASDGGMHKLWADAVATLGKSDATYLKVRPQLEKFYVEPAHRLGDEALPVAAVYVLREQRPPLVSGICQVGLADAALLLRRNAYRSWLVEKMNLDGRFFEATVNLQRHADVFYLTRPHDLAMMPQVTSWIDTHCRAVAA